VQCIFKYLKGTCDIYHRDTSYAFPSYSDSNYVTDLKARRFVTRYAFMIGNSLVSWKATLQPIVALSTTEEEYMTLA